MAGGRPKNTGRLPTDLAARDGIVLKKVTLLFGTRPEEINICPLANKLNSRESVETVICTIGQGCQMLERGLNILHVVPDSDLSILLDDAEAYTLQ